MTTTNELLIAEAKRQADATWEANEEYAFHFGPILLRLQAEGWQPPEPMTLVEEVARAISRRVDSFGDTERVEQQRAEVEWPRYREHAQAAIDLIRARLQEPEMQAKLVNVGVGAILNYPDSRSTAL